MKNIPNSTQTCYDLNQCICILCKHDRNGTIRSNLMCNVFFGCATLWFHACADMATSILMSSLGPEPLGEPKLKTVFHVYEQLG